MEVSPLSLEVFDPKLALLETARELGVAIVAYSPLGRGLITGQYVSLPIPHHEKQANAATQTEIRRRARRYRFQKNNPEVRTVYSRCH